MTMENVGGDGDLYLENVKYPVTGVKTGDTYSREAVGTDGYIEKKKPGEAEFTMPLRKGVTPELLESVRDGTIQYYKKNRAEVWIMTGVVIMGDAQWDHDAGTVSVKCFFSNLVVE